MQRSLTGLEPGTSADLGNGGGRVGEEGREGERIG